jgi:hypothetical protein
LLVSIILPGEYYIEIDSRCNCTSTWTIMPFVV